MEPVLTDKSQFPTEEIIFAHIGKSQKLWQSVFDHIHTTHPDFSEQWRYYNDRKSWLLKVSRKSKTICWVSIVAGAFSMTFYFGDKAEQAIAESSISDELRAQFVTAKKYGRIRGLTIIFSGPEDVENAMLLISIKLSIK